MQKRLACAIRGRVQGVAYRDFTLRHALRLSISGFVRNESDGSVFVTAEGEEEKLRELLRRLRRGNWFSRVEEVRDEWSEATGEFSGFLIVYS